MFTTPTASPDGVETVPAQQANWSILFESPEKLQTAEDYDPYIEEIIRICNASPFIADVIRQSIHVLIAYDTDQSKKDVAPHLYEPYTARHSTIEHCLRTAYNFMHVLSSCPDQEYFTKNVIAMLLHDIGKGAYEEETYESIFSQDLLYRQGRISEEERNHINKHPYYSSYIIQQIAEKLIESGLMPDEKDIVMLQEITQRVQIHHCFFPYNQCSPRAMVVDIEHILQSDQIPETISHLFEIFTDTAMIAVIDALDARCMRTDWDKGQKIQHTSEKVYAILSSLFIHPDLYTKIYAAQFYKSYDEVSCRRAERYTSTYMRTLVARVIFEFMDRYDINHETDVNLVQVDFSKVAVPVHMHTRR